MNDSIHNLRWATFSEQTINSIRSPNVLQNALTVLARKDGQICKYPSASAAASDMGVTKGVVSWAIAAQKSLHGWTFSRENVCKGRSLPTHPIHTTFRATDAQMYQTSKASPAWQTTGGNKYYECFVNGKKRQIHRLAVECILGRPLHLGEQADHVNGDACNWSIDNLW
jgi:hypothetical protein